MVKLDVKNKFHTNICIFGRVFSVHDDLYAKRTHTYMSSDNIHIGIFTSSENDNTSKCPSA